SAEVSVAACWHERVRRRGIPPSPAVSAPHGLQDRARRIIAAYRREVVALDQEPRLLGAFAFLVTFGLVRIVTHTLLEARGGGGLEIGGLHVHHMVFGIALLLIASLLDLANTFRRVRAMVFGLGAALVLDEFALILNLADVYWAPQGRESIDAVVLFGALLAVVTFGGGFWAAAWRELARVEATKRSHLS